MQSKIAIIKEQFEEAADMLQRFMADDRNFAAFEQAGELMAGSIRCGGKIFSCGNGGSMCDAMHFAEELTGRFRKDRKALPAIAIGDASHLTCTTNDYGFEHIFSRYIDAFGKPGDVLLAISTSGNSANILQAVASARSKGMKVVALTGKTGGQLSGACDIELRAPESRWSDRAQEIHIKIIHSLIQYIEMSLCPELYPEEA